MDKITKHIVIPFTIILVTGVIAITAASTVKEVSQMKAAEIQEKQKEVADKGSKKRFGEINKVALMPEYTKQIEKRREEKNPNIQTRTTIKNGKTTTKTKEKENCFYSDNKKVCLE